MAIEYRDLLKKYMRIILASEGIDYLDHIDDPFTNSKTEFSPEEITELEKISKEACAEEFGP